MDGIDVVDKITRGWCWVWGVVVVVSVVRGQIPEGGKSFRGLDGSVLSSFCM